MGVAKLKTGEIFELRTISEIFLAIEKLFLNCFLMAFLCVFFLYLNMFN